MNEISTESIDSQLEPPVTDTPEIQPVTETPVTETETPTLQEQLNSE